MRVINLMVSAGESCHRLDGAVEVDDWCLGGERVGGEPTFDVEQLHGTSELLSMGMSPSAISAEIGIPRATVYRIKDDPAKAVALLETWGIS